MILKILYLNDTKDPSRKPLDLINTFSNVARCKINLQKWVAFLKTNNKLTKKSGKRLHSQCPQNIKYIRINQPTNEAKDLCSDNYKTLKKIWRRHQKIEKTTNVHGVAEFVLWKWSYSWKNSTDSMQFP
jgi:hypothetical protein